MNGFTPNSICSTTRRRGSRRRSALHFNTFGFHEGQSECVFRHGYYLSHYADVAAAGGTRCAHYEQFGWKVRRDPSAAFDTLGYPRRT